LFSFLSHHFYNIIHPRSLQDSSVWLEAFAHSLVHTSSHYTPIPHPHHLRFPSPFIQSRKKTANRWVLSPIGSWQWPTYICL
jgi:hypothetical protein